MTFIHITALFTLALGLSIQEAENQRFSLEHQLVSLFHKKPASATKLIYNGGPVLAAAKVITVYWGGRAAVQHSDELDKFYGTITNSPWMSVLSEYSTATQKIGAGSFSSTFSDDNAPLGTLDDSDIQTRLKSLIAQGSIPTPDANTYLAVHFAPNIVITQAGAKSCESFCAFHSTMSGATGSSDIFYGVIPDQGGKCSGGCGNGNPLDNLFSVTSHEFSETITDAGVGLAGTTATKLGWYDDQNGEIGDICNGQHGQTTGNGQTVTVQKVFSNKNNACIDGSESSLPSILPPATPPLSTPPPSTPPPSTTCDHDKCTRGFRLDPTCDPCVAQIMAASPICNLIWEKSCIRKVNTICNLKC